MLKRAISRPRSLVAAAALLLGLASVPALSIPAEAANYDLIGACAGGDGDPATLIAAMNAANASPGADTIKLAPDCYYDFGSADNSAAGGLNALPVITSPLTITGQGSHFRTSLIDDIRYLVVYTDVTISGIDFEEGDGHNGDGGAIAVMDGILTIEDSEFDYNSAERGGALFVAEGADAVISGTRFEGNLAYNDEGPEYCGGGAIYSAGKVTITDSEFSDNEGYDSGGAICNLGTLEIDDVTMSSNFTRGHGGAIVSFGTLTVSSSLLSFDESEDGGGAIYSDGTLTVTNSEFYGNDARGSAAGAIWTTGYATILGTELTNNESNEEGGALVAENAELYIESSFFSVSRASGSGGALYLTGTSAIIKGSTF